MTRWDKQDKILKLTYKEINSVFSKLQLEIENLIHTLNFNFDELNSLSNRQYKTMKSKEFPKDSLISYYQKVAKTNYDILFILTYDLYLSYISKINDLSNEVFYFASSDSLARLPFKASVRDPLDFANILNIPYREYLETMVLTDAQETLKNIVVSLQNKSEIDLSKVLEKQKKRILNINENKYSGVLHDTAIKVANESYVAPLKNKNHKVKFLAVIDNRTTPMCMSMNEMVFNTVDRNSFDRQTEEGLKHYEIDGLVSGINLPPINNFTHHCRSWVELID